MPDVALGEAERIVDEIKDNAIVTRGLRVMVDSARRLNRHDVAGRALGLMIDRASAERRPALKLEQARVYVRANDRARALVGLDAVAATGTDAEEAEALLPESPRARGRQPRSRSRSRRTARSPRVPDP